MIINKRSHNLDEMVVMRDLEDKINLKLVIFTMEQ